MENKKTVFFLILACMLTTTMSCESQQQKFTGPPGYDFTNPKISIMPDPLREISGITFNKGRNDTLYAEQDEEGKIFHFKLGDRQIQSTRFWKKGDFEDITICRGFVVLLRSDGVLFTFPLSETNSRETTQVLTFENLLRPGEYEGLASTESDGKIFVLCKRCENEKTSRESFGYIFLINAAGSLMPAGDFEISVKQMEVLTGVKKINFRPSALAQNPITKEWFLLSASNKLLVVTDETWEVKAVYPLNPSLFPQPEGIAFDSHQTLYISNERNQAPAATILSFVYHGK